MADEPRKVDRGGGIRVTSGGFRIRNFSLAIDATTGELRASEMTPEVRAVTFQHWLEISAESVSAADAARSDALGAGLDDNETFDRALEREFRSSTIAIASAAFAVDAFYASVVAHAPDTKVRAKTRDGAIFETMKLAFKLRQANQTLLREQLRSLFRLRDMAVHPPAEWVEPVLHPAFNLGMEPRFIHFGVDNAILAHRAAHRLFWFCLRSPKRKHKELVEWCDAVKSLVDEPAP